MGPLTGIKILEIAGIGPGPFAAMMLSDMGADILRIDRADRVLPAFPSEPHGDLLNRGQSGDPNQIGISDPDPSTPRTYHLGRARPNPFNPRTEIDFDVIDQAPVQLKVYDISGRLQRTLVDGSMAPGRHMVAWDGRDHGGRLAAAGVYIMLLEAAGVTASRSIALVK